MIHSFTAKNFYSFKDEVRVDFTVNGKAPDTHGYTKTLSGSRVSKLNTVVGNNAAGKTNLLKVLPFLQWLIAHSYKESPDDKLPFRCTKGSTGLTELKVVFEINDKVYTYTFSLDRECIQSEVLKLTSMAADKNSTKTLFSRSWDGKTKKYTLNDANFSLPKGATQDALTRKNASVISAAARATHKDSQTIVNFWESLRSNVNEHNHGRLNSFHPLLLQKAVEFYKDNPDIKKIASEHMTKFDLGLSGFDIQTIKGIDVEEDRYEAAFEHAIGGEKTTLPVHYQSAGTQQLFILMPDILKVLHAGGILITDEMDLHLHPHLQIELIEMFTDPVRNPNNAQLFFSTQNPLVLNKLDKYQIVLCEKMDSGYSEAWRLDEVGGVRSDENYGAKYLAGAYGAIPRL